MKFRKTPKSARSVYTYEFNLENGKKKSFIIKPNEHGITDVDIRLLHRSDDRFVEQNNLQGKVPLTAKEKEEQARWKAKYLEKFEKEYGYIPNKDDLDYVLQLRFPKKYNASIELEAELRGDKSEVLAIVEDNTDEYAEAVREHIAELLKDLSDRDLIIYKRVLLNHESRISVAKDLGISESWVAKIAKGIRARIEADNFLKKFFIVSPDSEDSAAYDLEVKR